MLQAETERLSMEGIFACYTLRSRFHESIWTLKFLLHFLFLSNDRYGETSSFYLLSVFLLNYTAASLYETRKNTLCTVPNLYSHEIHLYLTLNLQRYKLIYESPKPIFRLKRCALR